MLQRPKEPTERRGQAGPCLRSLVPLPLPQSPPKLRFQALKSVEGSTSFVLEV